MFDRPRWTVLGPLLLLAACAAPQTPPPRPVRTVATPPPPPVAATRPGLANVMGKTASGLQALFGRPELDIEEGYARKLQFGNATCVLDAYLYPPARGGEAIVTHVDTRLPDGRDYDSATCVAALTRRAPTP
jgi:hypothetical protein